jgi:hypothetical protein
LHAQQEEKLKKLLNTMYYAKEQRGDEAACCEGDK